MSAKEEILAQCVERLAVLKAEADAVMARCFVVSGTSPKSRPHMPSVPSGTFVRKEEDGRIWPTFFTKEQLERGKP